MSFKMNNVNSRPTWFVNDNDRCIHNGKTRAMAATFDNASSSSSVSTTQHSPSHIPVPKYTSTFKFPTPQSPKSNSVQLRDQVNGEQAKWKTRYEEAEKRRKSLLTQNQKAEREYSDLQRRFQQLQNHCSTVQRQLNEKDAQLTQLTKASEGMYKEYDLLKNRYDVDQRVMQDAMKSASQWYRQNRELKRRSMALTQKFLQAQPDGAVDILDSPDGAESGDDDDLTALRNSVKEMGEELAKLQAELNAARLQEFEAQEQMMNLTSELEEERRTREKLQGELLELRTMKENLGRVSKLVAVEMTSLREQCQQEKEVAHKMKQEADKAQKERNVLAHQSALLISDIGGDDRFLRLLQEVETLKNTLEEERQNHAAEIQEIRDKLEERENEAQLELLEEKLKLAESELQCALQRAERAESSSSELSEKVHTLEVELEKKNCPPPPPPPPLPPPLPPSQLHTVQVSCGSTIGKIVTDNFIQQECESNNPVIEMANILGIPRKASTLASAPSGAIDDIINQIKGGKFTLKTTEKQREKKEETPAAVQEMLNVIGTLKRRPKNRASTRGPADVAL